jgi:hypothetical protein
MIWLKSWDGTTVTKHVTEGEVKDVVHSFPSELKELWPEAVRAG